MRGEYIVLNVVKITEKEYKLLVDWNIGKDENYLYQWAGPNVYNYPITIDQIKSHASEEFSQIYIILDNENPIGSIELEKINNETLSAHISRFILCDNAKNRGFGTMALKQLINIAFKELGLKKLTLNVFCFNAGAIRCYEKTGFLVKEFHQREDAKWNYYTMDYMEIFPKIIKEGFKIANKPIVERYSVKMVESGFCEICIPVE